MKKADKTVAIIGAGPAGLIAAQKLAEQGYVVSIYEQKPSVARKFLLAGRGGLNITHSEKLEVFKSRYQEKENWVGNWIDDFTPQMLRDWANDLGVETFVGSSGRVFPEDFRAKGLLRHWLERLNQLNVTFFTRHRWVGFEDNHLKFETPNGIEEKRADAVLCALGGGSYAHMGADGLWQETFQQQTIPLSKLRASNVGFLVKWSDFFVARFHGQPMKNICLKYAGQEKKGELMLTRYGVEGGAVYALSAYMRDGLKEANSLTVTLDLKPQLSVEQITMKLGNGRGRKSFSSWLKSRLNLSPAMIALLREFTDQAHLERNEKLAFLIKNCPIQITDIAPMDKAISTAGGVQEKAVTDMLMLRNKPGYFVAGEMLDWEAPTGGYLLQACFASGIRAAKGMDEFLKS